MGDRAVPGPAGGLIAFDGVGMTYAAASGLVEALRDISFAVGQGQLVALVGPSGCGKSPLLRSGAGPRPPTVGRVVVDGQPVTRPLSSVGMVFQAPVLLKWRRGPGHPSPRPRPPPPPATRPLRRR